MEYKYNYVSDHIRVLNKLAELTEDSNMTCISSFHLVKMFGLDYRTVKSRLKILELDGKGAFIDREERIFITEEGVSLLAKRLNKNNKD
jgi:hypothetical protein